MSDEPVKIPKFLASETVDGGIMPMCDFCAEVACETADMECGETCGQSCGSQCTTVQCGQCGSCEACQSVCQLSCQGCQSGCQTACEASAQGPTAAGSITSYTSTADSITIRYTSISKATWYQVVYRKTSASALEYIANGNSLTCTITGLGPDTSYIVNYRGATATEWGPFMATGKTIRTAPLASRPADWDWGYTVIPGARLPTAREWDDFCDWINEFRDYRGLSAYSFTRAYPGPTDLTAAMVNQTITAIKAMSPPTAPPSNAVKDVTALTAALLNGLAASLNSIG